ncbi:MAG: DNA-binding protein [Candidatus Dadabacteria bacterium]|nr:DNA-binding protein [Candidatus Dadabacteria bacterium]MCY4046955.1 DNA-binding protein [Candidatus Dadabacteria bacterium]
MNGENSEKSHLSTQVNIEQKKFFFDLKENHKGKYVRITEVSGGRSCIVIPLSGAESFSEGLADIMKQATVLD